MKKLCILASLLLGGCLSIVNNNGQQPADKTITGLGGTYQLEAQPTAPPAVIMITPTPPPLTPSDRAVSLPNPPVTRSLVMDCLPCDCAPCETPTPAPTCSTLDLKTLAAILDRGGLAGRYTFCRALSEHLMLDVAFGDRLALLNSGKKKEYTVLTRQGTPALVINNQLIQDEYEGKTNAVVEWLRCQLDAPLPDLPARAAE